MGGDTGHTVIAAGSVTSSSVNPNSQSPTLTAYQDPIDLSGLSFEAFKTSMETKILLSPVHQLVIPPPPEAAWYAPWNNPDFSWWEAAKWLSPLHDLGAAEIAFGSWLQTLGDKASSTDTYWGIALGTYLGMWNLGLQIQGNLTMAVDPGSILIDLVHNSILAGGRAGNSTYGAATGIIGDGWLGTAAGGVAAIAVGASAGFLYSETSLVGIPDIIGGVVGQDLATGTAFSESSRALHFTFGVLQLATFGLTVGLGSALEGAADGIVARANAKFSIRIDPISGEGPMAIDMSNFSGELTSGGAPRNALQFWKSWEELFPIH